MTTVFENLPEEKRRKVLEAALEEFAAHSYAAASTNRIVEKAEISKGLLFHYFKNKMGLYLYLLGHCMTLFTKMYEEKLREMDRDVFVRITQVSMTKLEQMQQYPMQYEFLLKATREQNPEIQQGYAEIVWKHRNSGVAMLYQDMDLSKFKPGTDIQKAIEMITWTLEGFGNKYMAENTDEQGNLQIDAEKALREMHAYCDLLKKGLYQEN